MPSFWQKAQEYLGLIDEEEVTEPDQGVVATVAAPTSRGRRVEPPTAARRTVPSGQSLYEPSVVVRTGSAVRPVGPMDTQSDIISALDFGDAKQMADRIRDRVPVILNLRDTEPEMVRRLVDFASGLTYALDGTMIKVAEGVILVLPPRLSLSREEKRRLADLGLYTLPDAGS